MDTCPVCKEYVFKSLSHRCKPLWHVTLLGYDEDGQTRRIYANDANEAAEKCAAQYDARGGDYPIIGEGEADAVVWDKYMANPVRFSIEAQSEPVYYASKSRESVPQSVIDAVENANG